MTRILYADDELILCEKAPGALAQDGKDSLLDDLRAQLGGEVYPVHRLDAGTGGAVCVARNEKSAAALSAAFSSHAVKKEYLCVCAGSPDPAEGEMRDYLYYLASQRKSYVTNRPRRGAKEALLSYKTLGTVTLPDGQSASLVRVRLHTGRTHQVRVQFASRGMPLLGDGKYGSRQKDCRTALWSASLTLPDGRGVTSDPPDVFPWDLFSDMNKETAP